ncbi:MAG TPA: SH3 domain-containing protein [Anaerolineae bacterium]|nr:SH3 domain-containing protein [Anaerolineae bacterium]
MNRVDSTSGNERLRLGWKRVAALLLLIGLVIATMGCSVGDLLVREPTAEPTATKTPRPTFTPTPQEVVLEQAEEQPAPAALAEAATAAPTEPPAEPTPLPPEPTPIPEPPTPTPPPPTPTSEPAYVIVQEDKVNVRKGPGTAYPVVGQVVKSTRLEVVAKNPQSDWFQICCFQGQQVWVVARLVEAHGPLQTVPVAANIPAPPPATATPRPVPPTATPRPVPTADPYMFFPPAQGNFPTSNDWLLVQAKIWNKQKVPLIGYRLKVVKTTGGGGEWTSNPSENTWFGSTWSKDFGDYKDVNAKIDTNGSSEQGTNTWRVWVIDGGGKQVSPAAEIHTDAATLRWHYLEFLAK